MQALLQLLQKPCLCGLLAEAPLPPLTEALLKLHAEVPMQKARSSLSIEGLELVSYANQWNNKFCDANHTRCVPKTMNAIESIY